MNIVWSEAGLYAIYLGPIVFACGLLISLWWKGLHREYPAFFLYWILDVLSLAVHLEQSIGTKEYFYTWLGFSIVRWVVEFLIVLEMVDRIFVDHPGVARVGRHIVRLFFAVAFVLSLSLIRYDWPTGLHPHLPAFNVSILADRVVSGVMLFFMMALSTSLWYFGIRLSRNTRIYCVGFTLYFLFRTAYMLDYNIRPGDLEVLDYLYMGSVAICQVLWMTRLTRAGALRPPIVAAHVSDHHPDRLLSTLNGLSARLLRARPPG